MKSYAVVFAGVPGSSKTPIANYLSIKFKLPVITADQIRFEIREDLRIDSIVNSPKALQEFEKRLSERTNSLLESGHPFIFDSSMDRRWQERKQLLTKAGYKWFMISLDLSQPFLKKLFRQTGRADFAQKHLNDYFKQHQDFLSKYKDDINLTINDTIFSNRIKIAAKGMGDFLKAYDKSIINVKQLGNELQSGS